MLHKNLITLGAVTIAGLAVVGVGLTLGRWRRLRLDFEFPMDDLFV